ncbi:DNA-processing protein DprA [Oceanobacillus halotolerans]|uniref:DNA-processing protein DprA n=1 Tax=Oceanobacillus halotolerans TaxID=2663380 RepID=UPI001CF76B2A|nr:DNA-processing protein DprA [Oceanobacillus halotolerans]
MSLEQLHQNLSIPRHKTAKAYNDLHNTTLISQIKEDEKNYHILTIVDEDYPTVLKPIKDPPLVLYGMGNLSLLTKNPTISVIGTRKPSHEAIPKIKHIVQPLVMENWVIVSGMARGIDSFAHQLALKHKGMTIAVLGGGFHHIYPKENKPLFRNIANDGLVLSEYPPNTPPQRFYFPERNRIISGLSFGTLVIEATAKSGTLITVDQALDQGREVYAVPGTPIIPQTKGCHQMIQDGAKLIHHAEDLKEDWDNLREYWSF